MRREGFGYGGGRSLAAVAALGALLAASGAAAEVSVENSDASIVVTADNESLSAVLDELGKTSPTTYKASVPLDKPIKGRFSGSLYQVLSQILYGYNYSIVQRHNETQIVIYPAGDAAKVSETPMASVAPAPTPLSLPTAPPPPPPAPGPGPGPLPSVTGGVNGVVTGLPPTLAHTRLRER
jgi:hypothetical protein